jgi:hypothetical protein
MQIIVCWMHRVQEINPMIFSNYFRIGFSIIPDRLLFRERHQ